LLAFLISAPLESARANFCTIKTLLNPEIYQLKKLLAVVLLGTALSTPALAENSPFYAGFLAGDQYLGVLGGYQINEMYSVEAHYAKVFHNTVNTAAGSIKTDNFGLGADLVVMLPWKIKQVPDLTFFGKGGMEYVRTKVTTTAFGTSLSATTNEMKLNVGGGAQYDVTKNFSARAGFGLTGFRNDLYVSAIFRF
jgi:opacity protein-like surface antigen